MHRLRDFMDCGRLPPGPLNAITDVAGVAVGHATIRRGEIHTGVTAIVPQPGNLFTDKVMAATEVINGFGKSIGLVQLAELGTLETPILLTNTLAVGTCANALIRAAVAENPGIGRTTSTVNPVVLECNDGPLNDIQAMEVTETVAQAALRAASAGPVEEGATGAGTGMTAFGFKGGIGTSSRRMRIAGQDFMLGALVLANFGRAEDLVLPDGRRPDPRTAREPEQGSVIVVLATDLPLDIRQLQRVARRAGAGLARLGAFWGHGSGDIALAFTTANRVPHDSGADFQEITRLSDSRIDVPFRAAAETTEEAVLNALVAAPEFVGRDGTRRPSLADWLISSKVPGRRPDP